MSLPARAKVVVIGSGAGGAPAAATLAQAWGDGVVILEAGSHLKAPDFNQLEREMVPRLYAGRGAQATEDGSVGILQGRVVGGSTVVNDALCFRPPPELAERWAAYGVKLDMREIWGLADEVESALGVDQIPKTHINRANYLVGLGAALLGWKGERLRHNATGCMQCGFRHIGCAYNAKQSMNLTFVPRAVEAGAQLFPDTEVHHLERAGSTWRVHSSAGVVEAEHVVLAAGIVQTPTILLRSGITAGSGLQFHVQTMVWGDFDDRVDGFNGIPMAYGVTEFSDVYDNKGPGYLIEGVSVQPLSFSVQPQGEGRDHEEFLQRYPYLAGALCLVRSKGRGSVTLAGDRPRIDYPLVPEDAVRIADFFDKGTRLFKAAGARRVLLAHRDTRWVTEPPTGLKIESGRLYLYTAHPFGGANRGTVTDEDGRVKGQPGLWVLDASAFPEALGVNPQVTIAALALQGARRIIAEAGA